MRHSSPTSAMMRSETRMDRRRGILNLSGCSVRMVALPSLTTPSTVQADHGPTGVRQLCYPEFVGLTACGRSWALSNNSAHPIQRENLVSSRLLRPPDSQAQPSAWEPVWCRCYAGTQGNHGSESPLAVGSMSRADQSHLPLAWSTSCREALWRGSSGENPDPTEEEQAGACQIQIAPVEAKRVAPYRKSSTIGHETRKSTSRVSCFWLQAFTTRWAKVKEKDGNENNRHQ